jgi:prepilin-type N-terminal cleavage/methylation domain-containing protein
MTRTRHNKAFSLVELLVAISIIVIVAAIAMPTLASAKQSAKITSHANDLKQLALTLLLYSSEYEGSGSSYAFPPQIRIPDVPRERWNSCPTGSLLEGRMFPAYGAWDDDGRNWYRFQAEVDPNPILFGSSCFDPNAARDADESLLHTGHGAYLDTHVESRSRKEMVHTLEFWSDLD